jgi:AcrR family transcriptional regulator
MVRKTSPARRRGRPREFDADIALTQALDVFWRRGFAATSLDDISEGTNLNRPSIYGAFGDKRELYIKAFRRYRERLKEEYGPLMTGALPVREKVTRLLQAALSVYRAGTPDPRGCFTVLTACSDAIADEAIRAAVAEALVNMDRSFERMFAAARADLPAGAEPVRLGRQMTAWLQTLSVRARAGVPREALEEIIEDAVRAIFGEAKG